MIGSPENPGSGTINLLCAFDYKGLMRNWLRFVKCLRTPFRPMRNPLLHKIGFVWQHWCPAKRGQADGGVGRGPGGPPSKNLRLRHRLRGSVLALQPLLEALPVKVNHRRE